MPYVPLPVSVRLVLNGFNPNASVAPPNTPLLVMVVPLIIRYLGVVFAEFHHSFPPLSTMRLLQFLDEISNTTVCPLRIHTFVVVAVAVVAGVAPSQVPGVTQTTHVAFAVQLPEAAEP